MLSWIEFQSYFIQVASKCSLVSNSSQRYNFFGYPLHNLLDSWLHNLISIGQNMVQWMGIFFGTSLRSQISWIKDLQSSGLGTVWLCRLKIMFWNSKSWLFVICVHGILSCPPKYCNRAFLMERWLREACFRELFAIWNEWSIVWELLEGLRTLMGYLMARRSENIQQSLSRKRPKWCLWWFGVWEWLCFRWERMIRGKYQYVLEALKLLRQYSRHSRMIVRQCLVWTRWAMQDLKRS